MELFPHLTVAKVGSLSGCVRPRGRAVTPRINLLLPDVLLDPLKANAAVWTLLFTSLQGLCGPSRSIWSPLCGRTD